MYSYQVTDCSIISIETISVGELSVGEIYCRRNVRVNDEMSVGEMCVGEMSGRRNVCRRFVCRRNFCRRNVLAPAVQYSLRVENVCLETCWSEIVEPVLATVSEFYINCTVI